jgi:hypothetical protein
MADRLGPLKRNERLAFIIETKGQPGKGYSRMVFTDIGSLIGHLRKYKRKDYAQLLASITIRKTTLTAWRQEAKPFRKRQPRRRRRPFRH